MAKAQGGWAGQALRATPRGLNSTRHSEAKSVSRPGRLLVPIYGLEVSKPTWEGCVPTAPPADDGSKGLQLPSCRVGLETLSTNGPVHIKFIIMSNMWNLTLLGYYETYAIIKRIRSIYTFF